MTQELDYRRIVGLLTFYVSMPFLGGTVLG